MKRQQHVNDLECLLYLLTGHPKHLPDPLQQPRKRLSKKSTVPAFISAVKPEVLEDRTKTNRHGPANPNMWETVAWKRHHGNGHARTHSDKIEEYAKRSTYFRVMSNQRKSPPGYNQSPCHRNFDENENPKIGPAHV